MRLTPRAALVLALLAVACSSGRGREDDSDTDPTPTGACGNGVRDSGETCDPAITSGDGECPTSCDDGDSCTLDGLAGSAAACTAACVHELNAEEPSCQPVCGNGRKEFGELCDGTCPTSCDDGNECTTDVLSGSVEACDATCTSTRIAGCGETAVCGNGVVEAGESCDGAIAAGRPGACPTSCGAAATCERSDLQGSASTCSARCVAGTISTCANGDGCCPSACTGASDSDCGGTPTPRAIGSACGAPGDCASGTCISERAAGWPGGYCTEGCQTDPVCGAGAHCVAQNGETQCRTNCTSNAQCRTGYACEDVDGNGSKECVLFASGVGLPGQRCTNALECGGGIGGWCVTEARGFKDGYCARECSASKACPSGSHCSPDGVCLANCTSNASCRGLGYECADVDADRTSECFPSGTGGRSTGSSCEGLWDCMGGTTAECISDWPGGYCSKYCGTGFSCPLARDLCLHFEDNSYRCLSPCTASTDCRTGYTCTTLGDGVTKTCLPTE